MHASKKATKQAIKLQAYLLLRKLEGKEAKCKNSCKKESSRKARKQANKLQVYVQQTSMQAMK